MKSLKPILTAVAAVVLLFAAGALIVLTNSGARQGSAASYTDVSARPDPVDSDTAPPQARTPVLKTNGRDADVYLQSLDIQVEVTGNMASTRQTMVFKNRANRVLEGTLTFPLPDGRSVTHYALDVDGRLREAVPVEKARGTEVFEAIELRRRAVVDPGLLERVEGNNFRARIYPFLAGETRTISIGYEEELTLDSGYLYYRMPMVYPDSLEEFAVKATVWKSDQMPIVPKSEKELGFVDAGENYVASFVRQNYRPVDALVFALPAPVGIPQVITQPAGGSRYFLASVAPNLEPREKQWGNVLAVIWDVSLSSSLRDVRREIGMLDIIFAEKKNADVHLYFLNNKFNKIADKNTANGEHKVVDGKWDGLKNALETAVFDGGTDFSKFDINNITGNEILFFSDGISTLSDADFLKNAKIKRPVHCVVSSVKADYGAMRLIAGKTNGKFVNINELSSEKLKNELLNETPLFLGAEHGKAVREVYPSVVTPVYGNFSVAGIADKDSAELSLLFGFGNKVEKRIRVRIDAKSAAEYGNIHKIWAQKKIAELDLDYEKNRAELTTLGKQFGIVTRNTSLIVLETVNDYINYGVAPPAELRDEYRRVLKQRGIDSPVASGGNVELWNALAAGVARRRNAAIMPDKAFSDKNYGSRVSANIEATPAVGSGDSKKLKQTDNGMDGMISRGGGDPRGGIRALSLRLLPWRRFDERERELDLPIGSTLIGARSRMDVRHTVMRNMNRLQRASSERLRKKHGYGGKITVKFTIDEFGKVLSARVVNTSRNDDAFADTVAETIMGWSFGKIDNPGDVTEVTYPFVFGDRDYGIFTIPMLLSGITLDGARVAAIDLKEWLAIDFTPKESKYPAPDADEDVTDLFNAPFPTFMSVPKDYLKGLTGKTADDYQRYLKLRDDYAGLSAFYFDMADWFYTHGDKETAFRVLTSIADLELENAEHYRLLGYRFKEYGEYGLAKFVCGKVLRWRPKDLQSHRDYALALADNGEEQAALDSLYSIFTTSGNDYNFRHNSGIEEIVVTEINRLIVRNPRLNTSKIDKRLIVNIPVDIRVVINWNSNAADIDLRVKDPNNQECSHHRDMTRAGGHISHDILSDYGPEQFLLKKAVKGKYSVYVDYYRGRQFTAAEPPTVMAEIFTKYADKAEERRVISLQMPNARKTPGILVAEFDF